MRSFKPEIPQRIVSLVPSITELLYTLGLNERVIGITKFCVHPEEWFRSKPRIGGTKSINIEKIISLQPDLILANKEENVKEQVEELAKHAPVLVTDVSNLQQALRMIRDIGEITRTEQQAQDLITAIDDNFKDLAAVKLHQKKTCAYLIWKEPYMTVGNDTFIHDMLEHCGFENAFNKLTRYPQVSIEDIASTGCEYILLSSEPFPFKEKHVDELKRDLPHAKIMLVDGELFSWYGSRLVMSPAYFKSLAI